MATAIIATVVCVIGSIVAHLYVLRLLWRYARSKLEKMSGIRIAAMVLGCVVGHLAEVSVFACGMGAIALTEDNERFAFAGLQKENLELWYYSAAIYTSLGDARPPTAALRVFVACEAVTGLILITWTASFLFLLMQRSWPTLESSARE